MIVGAKIETLGWHFVRQNGRRKQKQENELHQSRQECTNRERPRARLSYGPPYLDESQKREQGNKRNRPIPPHSAPGSKKAMQTHQLICQRHTDEEGYKTSTFSISCRDLREKARTD